MYIGSHGTDKRTYSDDQLALEKTIIYIYIYYIKWYILNYKLYINYKL